VRVEHGDNLASDQIPELLRLGIVIGQNPSHLDFPDLLAAPFPDRVGGYQPLRSLVEAGIPLASAHGGVTAGAEHEGTRGGDPTSRSTARGAPGLSRPRQHLPLEPVAQTILLPLQIEARLEVEPEPLGGAEVAG
jgi:hypothetical protein